MKKLFILLLDFVLVDSLFAQCKVEWNGYLQYRFSDDYLNQAEFLVRRAKVWVDGTLPSGTGAWSYKMQANFLQQSQYRFLLQDVLVSYKVEDFSVTAGQFVTDFGLQRKQPDYAIPLVERADVVNALVPAAETMARDIGVELKATDSTIGSFSLGFFNGNGANTVSNEKNFLYVNRGTLYVLNHSKSKLELGYNLSYRGVHNLQFSKIFGNNYAFTGKDFRFDFEGRFNLGDFELQGEYIEAHLGSQRAYGYYLLADYLIVSRHLVTLSVGQFSDLNPSTSDSPWYIVEYSYLMKGNDIKLSLDNKLQLVSDKTNSLTTLQIQYFFN